MFTGSWEVSFVPTDSKIPDLDVKRRGNLDNRINVALWKNQQGVIKNSTAADGTDHKNEAGDNGTCWGNGTANPVLGYSIETSDGDRIETAQMQ